LNYFTYKLYFYSGKKEQGLLFAEYKLWYYHLIKICQVVKVCISSNPGSGGL
jgi:hypothetical protein